MGAFDASMELILFTMSFQAVAESICHQVTVGSDAESPLATSTSPATANAATENPVHFTAHSNKVFQTLFSIEMLTR